MIGIICKDSERTVVSEFFELFKTPWQFFRSGESYEVVISTIGDNCEIETKLLIIYSGLKTDIDSEYGINICRNGTSGILEYSNWNVPIYNRLLLFDIPGKISLKSRALRGTPMAIYQEGEKKILRIGYNLFDEIKTLLSVGQPQRFAHIPTLEVHISMLKNWIVGSGIELNEILPIPLGYDYTVCLTHDVDFVGIRNHFLDHTMFGFLFRAVGVSFFDFLRKRISLSKFATNLKTVALLPAVYAKLAKDFWFQFEEYLEIEKERPSTFFFIPFEKYAGKIGSDDAPSKRKCKYNVLELKNYIEFLQSYGKEVGVHGIDAWIDSNLARIELNRIQQVAGNKEMGIRMHWLYFTEDSAKCLDVAGFLYDSTVGYNDAIGYRAGTCQVFRPLGATRLLELPLHVQDTALFYRDRMNLDEFQAEHLITNLISNTKQFGGVITFNWHHRSLGPERLWGNFYSNLIKSLKKDLVWFARACDVVRWFRRRRRIKFSEIRYDGEKYVARILDKDDKVLPNFILRRFFRGKGGQEKEAYTGESQVEFFDYPLIVQVKASNA